jgi:hypothetical protein
MSENIKESYYRQNLPDLIADLKVAVKNNRLVIVQDASVDLTEDKFVNVLKSRRMAADDTIHFLKEIDRLEAELENREPEEGKSDESSVHPSKRNARG